MVTVKRVTTKSEKRKFVDFPNKLYKDVPEYVPDFYADGLDDFEPEKNPAFEYCEAERFLAYKDGKIVGRIAAILSYKANKKWDTNSMRFTQVDFIDDKEVSKALFDAVEKYAREKGCEKVQGPLGFTDIDSEGMLVEGFDQKGMFFTFYNYPYYKDHLENLGYHKDTDWIEYKIYVPKADNKQIDRIEKIAKYVMKKHNFKILNIKKQSQYAPYVHKVFELSNAAYAPLYGMVELSDKQIERFGKKFIPILNPDYTCFVVDKDDNMVAFGIAAPSLADAMKKCDGKLFPFGWFYVLRAMKNNKALDLLQVAVRPDLQGEGVNAIIINHLLKNAIKNGIEYAETGPMLETNEKILSQWKIFEKDQHKRRRCYIKNI